MNYLLIFFFLAIQVRNAAANADRETQPNILFIAVDDLRVELGCYGVQAIRSPNIDRFAASGVAFTRAYCQQSVCNPSRASLLTGLRPDTTKVWDLDTDFRSKIPEAVTIPQHFRQHGYRAVAFGKIFHNTFPDNVSWDEPTHWPEGVIGYSQENQQKLAAFKQQIKSSGKSDAAIARIRGPATEIQEQPDEKNLDGKQTTDALEKLRELAGGKSPFFLAVGYIRPHLPFITPKKYWDLYDRAKIPLATNPFLPHGAPAVAFGDKSFGGFYELRDYMDYSDAPSPFEHALTEAQQHELKHGYYASVSFIDTQVGRLLDELDRLGLAKNTIVVLWGDNGWKLGEHGGWCKQTNYEVDARVPLMIRVPGAKANGKQSDALVELVDIYPTLCELAPLPVPKTLEGKSLVPLLTDPAAKVNDAAFSQFPRKHEGREYMGYAMRTGRYRYIEWLDRNSGAIAARELYDHDNDEEENENIAGHAENAALLDALSAQMWKSLPRPQFPGADEPLKPAAKLRHLLDEEWDHTMETSPTWASELGDRRWNDRWPDVSLAAMEREHVHDQQVLERLIAIPRDALPAADQLNYDMFRLNLEESIEGFHFGRYLIPLDQRGGIQTQDELGDALRFETVKDYEDWIARLHSFDAYMDQTIALLREGMRRRLVQPKITMQRLPAQIARQMVATPEQSPFFSPLRKFPAAINAADQARLTGATKAAIRESILPAYERFRDFFTGEYLPACFDHVGAWQWPEGEAMYAFLARQFTTTKFTPEEIHKIGLDEVARIRGEMEKVKLACGFKGALPAFFQYLRTDPRFYCSDAGQLLIEYRATAKRIDPTLSKVFRTLPRAPYGVEPVPEATAPDTSAAYYRPLAADGSRAGTFFVNLYKPETRPRWEMMVLSLHEAVPGHHFQFALAQEQGALPHFRQHAAYTAYVEGWALYCESLGDEFGLYDDPYNKFGQLTFEMWRAVRLVVDTGLHAFHWDREKAIAYFRDNTPRPEQDIVNEVDRYISWPGQALAYKIGELKIKELRARATRELGPEFDLKEFHDIVLLGGSMPLSLLEQRVDEWIRSNKK